MHRVEELADRPLVETREETPASAPIRSAASCPCRRSCRRSTASARSRAPWSSPPRSLVGRLGPEIDILERLPLEDVARAGDSLLLEALTRLRAGQVRRDAGYDGEYGVIRLFEPDEIRRRAVVAPLFHAPIDPSRSPLARSRPCTRASVPRSRPPVRLPSPRPSPGRGPSLGLDALDPEQRAAAEIVEGPLLIVAGPGTGKTRTLTHRLAHLIAERGVSPEQCLAVTFSRRAAAEMEERLAALVPEAAGGLSSRPSMGSGCTCCASRPGASEPGLRLADRGAARSPGALRRIALQGRAPARGDRPRPACGRDPGESARSGSPPTNRRWRAGASSTSTTSS